MYPDELTTGREEALSQLADWLSGDKKVVYIHGIGGIGKSALIRHFLSQNDRPNTLTFWGGSLPSIASDYSAEQLLVVLDGLDQAPGGEGLVRQKILPMLNEDAVVLIASRQAPDLRWRTDLGDRFADLELEGLDESASLTLLERGGVPAASRAALAELCHGHPLMLLLAAELPNLDEVIDGGLEDAPKLVTALVEAFGALPREAHLANAMTVCAIARRTTEPLLRTVLGLSETHTREAFETLRTQEWIAMDRDGLYPHDLVRDALRADAKWRGRPDYDALFRAVADYEIARLRAIGAGALSDVVFLLADNPVYRRVSAHRHGIAPGPSVPVTDIARIRQMLEPHFGATMMRRLEQWDQASALRSNVLFGPDGEPAEAFCLLDEDALANSPTDDPAVLAARELLNELNLRDDARIVFCRAYGAREWGQSSPVSNSRIMVAGIRMGLSLPGLAAIGSVLYPPELWLPIIERMSAISVWCRFTDGDREYLVHFQDMRTLDPAGWLQMQLYPPELPISDEVEMLDRDEFGIAVRQALKGLKPNGPDLRECRLTDTPLAFRSAADPSIDARADAIAALCMNAIDAVTDDRARLALHHTYVEPATKQYAAALELGVSFSTFRRALGQGLDEVAEHLWQREVAAAL